MLPDYWSALQLLQRFRELFYEAQCLRAVIVGGRF